MTTWLEKLQEIECAPLFQLADETDRHPFSDMEWNPTEADRAAAWGMYSEVRTRITTQPLAYRAGDEETALTSVYNLFQFTRDGIKKHEGCTHFSTLAVYVLNTHIRPFTAYWHKQKLAGRLSSSDSCHLFRHQLAELQKKLRLYMRLLSYLAEGGEGKRGFIANDNADSAYPTYPMGSAIPFGLSGSQIPIPNASAIDAVERAEVLARRKGYGLSQDPTDAVGLAISGGGIRSATFSLGVVQHLARKGMLKSVDFISTVSGGGYTGSFISTYLNDPDNANANLDPDADPDRPALPFGRPGDVESKAVRHMRNHSKYMAEGGVKTYALFLGQMLYGIGINLLLAVPFILLAVVVAYYAIGAEAFLVAADGPMTFPPPNMRLPLFLTAIILVVSAALLPLVQNIARTAGRRFNALRTFISLYERFWCVGLLSLLILMVLWSLLPLGYRLYDWVIDHGAGLVHALVITKGEADSAAHSLEGNTDLKVIAFFTSIAAALPFLAGIMQFFTKNGKIAKKLSPILLAISGPFFYLVAFFSFTDYFTIQKSSTDIMGFDLTREQLMWAVFLIAAAYGIFFVNINFTSPHRYYRRQLSRTFLRRAVGGRDETRNADEQRLSELATANAEGNSKAPYHIINCALNIPSCDDPNLLGRASDFFMFSKHYSGSPTSGYHKTTEWEAIDGHLDLATAMAISAAAASPQMGTLTQARISYLMAILNVRLNYWAAPPRRAKSPDKLRKPIWFWRMNCPGWLYFAKEMTGLMMHENDSYLNLSDGGHVENLAVYELLRRRCKFVIAIDGEADPTRRFQGLLTLVRLADIDLGVKIKPDLHELRVVEDGNSRAHFMMCPIDYGNGDTGLLLYIKSSMTGNELEFLMKYRNEHPAFPHEPTSDQLFDETQFEAYRALGEHVGQELFRPELINSIDPAGAKLGSKPTLREWFQGMANSLLG